MKSSFVAQKPTTIAGRRTGWKDLSQAVVACKRCPRLVRHCQQIAEQRRKAYADFEYWGRPVPNFGNSDSELLVVGLAPGAHGANRTGRMFTGDRSGEWLYRAMHRAGFANQATSELAHDGLKLINSAVTNICRCAPPDNKPTSDELRQCRDYLMATLQLSRPKVLLALGGLAWNAIVKIAKELGWLDPGKRRPKFGHGEIVELTIKKSPKDKSEDAKFTIPRRSTIWMIGSYHPSQQNTFTGRLTEAMLDNIFNDINLLMTGNHRS